MRPFRLSFTLMFLLVLFLTACGPQATATPLGPTSTSAPADTATPAPTSTPEPTATTALVEVSLPEAAIGSMMMWYDGAQLLFVPEGPAILGHTDPDNPTNPDGPQHTVEVGSFWMYRFPVTNQMYTRCVLAGQCSAPVSDPLLGYPDYTDPALKDNPVVGVTYANASAYCSWMGGSLPTEAQWEKAGRGPDGRTYPWGEDAPTCTLANFQNCLGKLTKVFDFPDGQSQYYILDLAGNTFEWVLDWYDPAYYGGSPSANPGGPEIGTVRSVRGSGLLSGLSDLPLWRRFFLEPDQTRNDLGFRCVIAKPAETTGYAPYCQQNVYVPGVPVPGGNPPPMEAWVVGNAGSAASMVDCTLPDIYLQVASYCAAPPSVGGANVKPTVLTPGSGDAWDYTVSPPAECLFDVALNKYVCDGPVGSKVNFDVCRSCTDLNSEGQLLSENPMCAQGYTLDPATGMCNFEQVLPDPNQNGQCAPGWQLDPNTNLCVQIVPPSQLCPAGYQYDAQAQCCVANFTDPSVVGGIPGASYLGCPLGWAFDPVSMKCTQTVPLGAGMMVGCGTVPVDLGTCEVVVTVTSPPPLVCTNPSQYNNNEPACLTAGCKWRAGGTFAGAGTCY